MNEDELVQENFAQENNEDAFNFEEDENTKDIDGIFIDIPLKTYQNTYNRAIEVTSRRTQLGVEDNDHRSEKAKEVTLEIVFEKIHTLDSITQAIESTDTQMEDHYKTFLEYFDQKKKGTLVLMKKQRIIENMTIVGISETEIYEDDCISKVIQATFKEIRLGESTNNLEDEENVEGATNITDGDKQSTGNNDTSVITNVYKE